MALTNDAGKTGIMETWATMWRKMAQGVGSFSGCSVTQSPEDWQKFFETEAKRNSKKNMKILAKEIAGYISSYAADENGDPVLPAGVPPEILVAWKAGGEDIALEEKNGQDQGSSGHGKEKDKNAETASSFETEVQKFKKDILVSAVTIMQTEDAKAKEATKVEAWAHQVKSIISVCSGGEGDDSTIGILSGGALPQGSEFLQRFPTTSANKHWLAQQAAALATQICQRIEWLQGICGIGIGRSKQISFSFAWIAICITTLKPCSCVVGFWF